MKKRSKIKVLCVDDEPHVLEGLALQLRRTCDVHTAPGGAIGLEIMGREGSFAVVLSDMRMPGMDGATFLSKARKLAPDTVRMLLTGQADLEATISAVNEGQIFRFLTKPCPPDQLRLAFVAAVRQHRLLTSERVLLEQTLHGSIKTLTDILAMTSPVAYGRATRIKKNVIELANALDLEERWKMEVAAMLSQLGSVSLPDDIAEKYYYGEKLDAREKEMVARMPKVTEDLLANIPRMGPVREILSMQHKRIVAGRDSDIPVGARVLKIAADYDALETAGMKVQMAFDTMRNREGHYDPEILQEFFKHKGTVATKEEVREVSSRDVTVGMVFAEDVRTSTGILLVARGYEVTPSFVERLRNFGRGQLIEPLRMIVPAEVEDDE